MENVRAFVRHLQQNGVEPGRGAERVRNKPCPVRDVYAGSLADAEGATFFLARVDGVKNLVCWGPASAAQSFSELRKSDDTLQLIPCTTENVAGLHAVFPFTAPRPVADQRTTFGCGDRLGLATPGHVRALRGYDASPVLAQQSMRELHLTGRTFREVIATASWGVFQEHFTLGYGADADHLKTEDEIEAALADGATMITLDCSDHIDPQIAGLSEHEALVRLQELPPGYTRDLERRYQSRDHEIRNFGGEAYTVSFTPSQLARAILTYGKALDFTRRVFERFIRGTDCDFELSIDETQTPTDPAAHYFVASELTAASVKITSLAPRFTGEFQKGIDYIGEPERFEREFAVHAALADHFGYKLSIHSGSDKFSIFPTIGKHTGGRLHHKTAGTSWLEALRLVATSEPAFFRDVYAHARASFAEAARYYHVGVRPRELEPIDTISDEQLPGLLDHPGHRQLLHITYGLILNAAGGGRRRFRPRLYELLEKHEEQHYTFVERHIGRHLAELGIARRSARN